jgi:hypothetical protein
LRGVRILSFVTSRVVGALAIRNGSDETDDKLMAAKRNFVWRERDNRLLQQMGIAPLTDDWDVDVTPEAQAELREAIQEPIGRIGRLARVKHADDTESRKVCLTQDEAVAWLERTMRPLDGDELIIEKARRPKDLNCDPYPRQMTHADRVFLRECGIFLHMLSWRDGFYRKARE